MDARTSSGPQHLRTQQPDRRMETLDPVVKPGNFIAVKRIYPCSTSWRDHLLGANGNDQMSLT